MEIMWTRPPKHLRRQLGTNRDKWETSLKSCGQRIQSVVRTTMETSGGKVGDKCEIMGTRALRVYWEPSGGKWETSLKSCGQKIESVFSRKTSPHTNVKSCFPSMPPFQRSKNPSQVNLIGKQKRQNQRN